MAPASETTLIVGIAGGSGSGKTTFARRLLQALGVSAAALVFQDSYYIDQSAAFDGDGGSVNFDHPQALDFSLMAGHLRRLKQGRAVEIPIYDFATHERLPQTRRQEPCEVIVVDGTLILHSKEVREVLDHAIFLSADRETRFARRLDRDVKERGRQPEGVRRQFELQVQPMHELYVEPSRAWAHIVIGDEDHKFEEELKWLTEKVEEMRRGRVE